MSSEIIDKHLQQLKPEDRAKIEQQGKSLQQQEISKPTEPAKAPSAVDQHLSKLSSDDRAKILQQGQNLDRHGAVEKPINYEHEKPPQMGSLSRPYADAPSVSNVPTGQPQAQTRVDRALSEVGQSKAAETGKELQKSGATIDQSKER